MGPTERCVCNKAWYSGGRVGFMISSANRFCLCQPVQSP